VSVVETALSNWQLDKSYDILIHAASPASPTKYGDARSVLEANVGFLENLADQKMPETTLFVSSGEVYGAEPPEGVLETQKVEAILNGPRAVYPQAKIAAENLLIDLGGQGITNPLIARLFHSFGPGLRDDDGRSFGDFLWSAARRRDISMLSPGDAVRTFLYLEDAVAGLLAVLTEGLSGETYNVGSELPVTILEFANSVAQVSGVEVTRATDLDIAKRAYVSSPIASIIPSTKKLRDLGWSQEVALTEGIARSIDWLRRQLT
jgi:nucleoside-diphosphate-sugar epimerase